MKLHWNVEGDAGEIPPDWIPLLDKLLQEAATHEDWNEGEVSLTFVDDELIRELNRDYRGVDRATDVLSFPLHDRTDGEQEIWHEHDAPDLLGDIVISMPTAKRQSEEYGHSLQREVAFLFVHGLLHLFGYDHSDESGERRMFALQEKLLTQAGVTR